VFPSFIRCRYVKTANELRSILTKMNITNSKVKIDLDNDTIEVEDDYSIDDILDSAGVLTPKAAKVKWP